MKYRHLFSVAIAALMLGACSNEELITGGEDSLFGKVPEGMTEYQFKMTGITPTHISYATVNMEKNEMKIFTARALIFEQTGDNDVSDMDANWTLGKVIDGTVRPGTDKVSYLLDQNVNFGSATKLAFYVIANYEGSNIKKLIDDGTIKERKNAVAGSTYQDLIDKLTTMDNAGHNKLTQGLLMTSFNTNNPAPADGVLAVGKVNFRRPFARFDVKNDGMKSLHIEKLQIANVWSGWHPLQTLAGTDADKTTVYNGFNIGLGELLEGANIPDSLNRPKGVTTSPTDKDKVFVPGVFYAYPTKSGEGPKLLISGTLSTTDGVETLTDYEVPFAKKDGGLVDIDTNTRYLLTIRVTETDDVIAEFETAPVPWGEGSEDKFLLDDYTTVVSMTSADGATTLTEITGGYEGTVGGNDYLLKVASNSAAPTDANLGTTVTAVPTTRTADPDLTGTPAKVTTYKVHLTDNVLLKGATISFTFNAGQPLAKKITIIQPKDPSYIPPAEDEYPKGDGTYIKGTTVGTLIWAPFNVGATEVKEIGNLYQWGRNRAWASKDEAMANVISTRFSPEDSETIYNDKFYQPGGAFPDPWWPDDISTAELDALKKRWSDPSDGTTNPCPEGWRLPLLSNFIDLCGDTGGKMPAPTDETGGIWSRVVSGVTFIMHGNTIDDATSVYMGTDDTDGLGTVLRINSKGSAMDDGMLKEGNEPTIRNVNPIRCVKDVAP